MAERPSQKALADFISEAQEVIEALDRDLVRLEETRRGDDADPDTLNAVFRAAHSLKGLSAMFGVERMTRLAHALEDRLDDVRMGRRALDGPTLDLLLGAPGLFGRIIAEEAAERPPLTADAAEQLAARLRGSGQESERAAVDAVGLLELDPSVRAVLTEYEEHRLRTGVERGVHVYRVRVGFDLASFDTGLEELKARLKQYGEVIATLPSADPADPDAIAFDVLFGSAHALERARSAAGPAAAVEEIARRDGSVPSPEAPLEPGAAARAAVRPAEWLLPSSLPLDEPAAPAPSPGEPPPTPLGLEPVVAPSSSLAPVPPATLDDASLRSVSQAVRVDIRKLDRLMNLVGELVIVKTSLLQLAERLRGGEASATIGLELHRESRSLERKVTELQAGVLEVRMVPLGQIFDKLARMVRKLTRDLGKQVDFQVRGSEVEVDKLIVEDLSDPLMHLIRNALDHAIEPPEVRRQAGKPPAGLVTLSASQKGNHVLVTVADDGAGIDERRLREVAVERGLASPEAVAQLTRREVMSLIFVPGFSTARQVTALSGRGVGMDVVKSNIARMSGLIDLHTELGKGTRFEITLPVTLAIVRALVVSSAGRSYAIPLSSVLEIVTVPASEVGTIEAREVISLRGTTLPLVRLDRFLGTPGAWPNASLYVVVVGLAHERLGMVVDGLVGQQDIVVKPLGRALAGVRGIAGATDLGNRRTVLVLDVAAIIEEIALGDGVADAVP